MIVRNGRIASQCQGTSSCYVDTSTITSRRATSKACATCIDRRTYVPHAVISSEIRRNRRTQRDLGKRSTTHLLITPDPPITAMHPPPIPAALLVKTAFLPIVNVPYDTNEPPLAPLQLLSLYSFSIYIKVSYK